VVEILEECVRVAFESGQIRNLAEDNLTDENDDPLEPQLRVNVTTVPKPILPAVPEGFVPIGLPAPASTVIPVVLNGDRISLLGNCLEVMKGIPSKSIAFMFVGLPYGATEMEWDKPFKQRKYLRAWLVEFWAEVRRIMMDGGVVCCQAAETLIYEKNRPVGTFATELKNSNSDSYLYSYIWVKQQPSDWHAVKKGVLLRPRRKHEVVVTFCIGSRTPRVFNEWKSKTNPVSGYDSEGRATNGVMWGPNTNSNHKDNPLGLRYLEDVIYMSTDRSTRDEEARSEEGLEEKADTPNPIALPWLFAKIYSNENEWCLDPTMGTGTSVLAFIHAGRKGMGIELEKDTFEGADRAIASATFGDDRIEQAEALRTNNFSEPAAWVECAVELDRLQTEFDNRILVFVKRHSDKGEGITSTYLAKETVSDGHQVRGCLARLKNAGLVVSVKQEKGANLWYEKGAATTLAGLLSALFNIEDEVETEAVVEETKADAAAAGD
jgi:DNA modification methylase